MNLLKDKIKPIYLKYLTAAFGSALISSIYGVVDMAMVGKYHGPDGSSAMAVVSPMWNIIFSLGLLMGIGGSVLFSAIRGKDESNYKESNEFFTASIIGAGILSIITWLSLIFFDKELLMLFGADENLIGLAREYVFPLKFVVPCFIFSQVFASFLRNDNNPSLATKAVIFGGIFNVFGDYFCVFTLDLGIMGAGIATAVGNVFSIIIMCTHFFRKKNTLHLVKPTNLFIKLKNIIVTGFSTFFIDIAMGILTVLFNRQILKYLGYDALSVYGVIINISTFVQCCAYSIGQASQPIISSNYGAGNGSRINQTLKYAIITCIIFGVVWTSLSLICPNLYINIFMKPTENILKIAPSIIRVYALSFMMLPINIFSTYYFQAIMKPKISFIVSVLRGAILSSICIYVLPLLFTKDAIWLTMPITELIVLVFVLFNIIKYTKAFKTNEVLVVNN